MGVDPTVSRCDFNWDTDAKVMKALVGAFNQEKALVGAFSAITNFCVDLRLKL